VGVLVEAGVLFFLSFFFFFFFFFFFLGVFVFGFFFFFFFVGLVFFNNIVPPTSRGALFSQPKNSTRAEFFFSRPRLLSGMILPDEAISLITVFVCKFFGVLFSRPGCKNVRGGEF